MKCLLISIPKKFFYLLSLLLISSAQSMYAADQEQQQAVAYAQQARNFYQRFMQSDHKLDEQHLELYYKKIEGVRSAPAQDQQEHYFFTITVDNQLVSPENGMYRYKNIVFRFVHTNQGIFCQQLYDGQVEESIPCDFGHPVIELLLPRFETFADLTSEHFQQAAFFRERYQCNIYLDDDGIKYVIGVDCSMRVDYPLGIQGMGIVLNKKKGCTHIYFDFVNDEDVPITYMVPMFHCQHVAGQQEEQLFSVDDKRHTILQSQASNIRQLFTTGGLYAAWLGDGHAIYNMQNGRIERLPSCYPIKEVVDIAVEKDGMWVEEQPDSWYRVDNEQTLVPVMTCIYAQNNGPLLPVMHVTKTVHEYGSLHTEILNRFERLQGPPLQFEKDVTLQHGHAPWPQGLYRRSQTGETIVWDQIVQESMHGRNENGYPPQSVQIEQWINHARPALQYNYGLYPDWQSQTTALSTPQMLQWCEAAEHFFESFTTKIITTDRWLPYHLKKFNRLTSLDISNLTTENTTLNNVLQYFADIPHLIQLQCAHNSPVDCTSSYQATADRADTFLCAMAACLMKLKKLQKLHIQGSWLVPYSKLGYALPRATSVSKEVAIVTGCITHNNKKGIEGIMRAIKALPDLQELYIDGIPNNGTSFSDRTDPSLLDYAVIVPALIDRNNQETTLQELITSSSTMLATKPSLTKLKVYTPRHWDDYFSKKFVSSIATTPRPISLPRLTIDYDTLG